MEETKVRIGDEVVLDIGTHSEWYISSLGYDGESVDITLRRKSDRGKDWWWLVDPPQTDCDDRYAIRTDSGEVMAYACPLGCEQTDCGWK